VLKFVQDEFDEDEFDDIFIAGDEEEDVNGGECCR